MEEFIAFLNEILGWLKQLSEFFARLLDFLT